MKTEWNAYISDVKGWNIKLHGRHLISNLNITLILYEYLLTCSRKQEYRIKDCYDVHSDIDCRRDRARHCAGKMRRTFTYSYRSRYRGSLAPLFRSSLETPDELEVPSSNVELSFLSFVRFLFLVFNSHTNSCLGFEVTIGWFCIDY